MTAKKPDLSVIIPVFNRAAQLKTLLQSLKNQKLCRSRFEIIVSDDGSTEDIAGIARQSGAIYIRNPHRGRAAARNAGIKAAQGGILVFLDSDCIASRVLLHRHLHYQRQHTGIRCAAIMGAVQFPPDTEVDPVTANADIPSYLSSFKSGSYLPVSKFLTCNISVPTEIVIKSGGFSECFKGYGYEDLELGWRLVRDYGLRIIFQPEALAWHMNPRTPLQWVKTAFEAGASSIRIFALQPDTATALELPVMEALKEFANLSEEFCSPFYPQNISKAQGWLSDRLLAMAQRGVSTAEIHAFLHYCRVLGAYDCLRHTCIGMKTREECIRHITGKPVKRKIIADDMPGRYTISRDIDAGLVSYVIEDGICDSRLAHFGVTGRLSTFISKSFRLINRPVRGVGGLLDTLRALAAPVKSPLNIKKSMDRYGLNLKDALYFEIIDKLRRVRGCIPD